MFATSKRFNIRFKCRDWPRKLIRQVMIWHLRMQRTLGMLYFQEQLITDIRFAKYAHYLLGVAEEVWESSRWKYVVLIKIEDVASKKIGRQIYWTSIIWFRLILWHIQHCRLSNAKSSLYTYIKICMIWFGWVWWHVNHCTLFNVKSSLYIYIYKNI